MDPTWPLSVGIVLGAAIGSFQGAIIAFRQRSSFIVTLGGLLVGAVRRGW